MLKHDYLEAQIEALCKTIAAVIFGSEAIKKIFKKYEDEKEASDPMHEKFLELKLLDLLKQNQTEEARAWIFSAVSKAPNIRRLIFALDGYNKLREAKCLSESEIERDLSQIRSLYDAGD
ncbi:MAG: DUF6483 family protein [Oscillospiraceae bacterium]|nr:DUF6483 family protein [Oscillospiraceae bacterium]